MGCRLCEDLDRTIYHELEMKHGNSMGNTVYYTKTLLKTLQSEGMNTLDVGEYGNDPCPAPAAGPKAGPHTIMLQRFSPQGLSLVKYHPGIDLSRLRFGLSSGMRSLFPRSDPMYRGQAQPDNLV